VVGRVEHIHVVAAAGDQMTPRRYADVNLAWELKIYDESDHDHCLLTRA
jgi:hypothetical protein